MLIWEICLRNIKWKKHIAKQCIEQYFLNSLPYLYLHVCLSDFLGFLLVFLLGYDNVSEKNFSYFSPFRTTGFLNFYNL